MTLAQVRAGLAVPEAGAETAAQRLPATRGNLGGTLYAAPEPTPADIGAAKLRLRDRTGRTSFGLDEVMTEVRRGG